MSRSAAAIQANLDLAIQPSPNGRHLSWYSDSEKPFFWLADTAWELFHRLDKVEAEMYLRNRAQKGFNVVMIVILAEYGGLDYPNRYGEWPFETVNGQQDVSRPNVRYFELVDWVVDLAASLGIRVALVPTWGRYINGGYHLQPILFNVENAYTYGHFLGERYPYLPFLIGGDSNRYWNHTYNMFRPDRNDITTVDLIDYGPVFESLARGIIDGEAVHSKKLSVPYKTLMTFHPTSIWMPQGPEATSSANFPHADWVTLDGVQSGHSIDSSPPALKSPATAHLTPASSWSAISSYVPIRRMYATERPGGGARPLLDLEPHYENTHHWFDPSQGIWSAGNIRRGAWQGIFAGACGYSYGCNSIWQMHNDQSKTHPPITSPTVAQTNWYLELDLAGAFQSGIAKRVMESLPGFFDRIPDQSIILSDTVEPKGGKTVAGEELISGMRSVKGLWLMVHLPFGGVVKVDLSVLCTEKKWRGWWIDPRVGSRESFGWVEGHSASLAAPDKQDWLLYIGLRDI